MASNRSALAGRFEGRLFTEGGWLCYVLAVDLESGIARVNYHNGDDRQIVEMPLAEVGLRLSSTASLDGPNGDSSGRVVQRSDGWFFTTREGPQGPFSSAADADVALNDYLLSVRRTA